MEKVFDANLVYRRARMKAFWNATLAALTGRSNRLLAWDEVKDKLHIGGQIYRGLQEVPVEKVIGSFSRYRDFDRVFLPTQEYTAERWKGISRAFFAEASLPPVKLYKIGEAYFVVDGNHRVSVAREQGRDFIDAEVIEAQSRVPIGPDLDVSDLEIKGEYTEFLERTQLDHLRPDQQIEFSIAGGYQQLLEHVAVHRHFMGLEQQRFISEEEAVVDWYDTVYMPIVQIICEQNILYDFPSRTEADLYLWIIQHQHFLQESGREISTEKAAETFAARYTERLLKRIYLLLQLLLQVLYTIGEAPEYAQFLEQTNLDELRPDHDFDFSGEGGYQRLLEHIAVHRHFMGQEQQRYISQQEAAEDWYDNVYLPIVKTAREQNLLALFPERTASDLYLRIVEHLHYLRTHHRQEVTLEQAVEDFVVLYSAEPAFRAIRELLDAAEEAGEAEALADFYRHTQLDSLRSEAELEVTLGGGYQRMLEHIAVHRHFMGLEQQRFIAEEEAVLDWYDNVYRPIVEVIRQTKILRAFPKRTEADLYLWTMEYRHLLMEKLESIAEEIPLATSAERYGGRLLKRAVDTVQQLLKNVDQALEDKDEE